MSLKISGNILGEQELLWDSYRKDTSIAARNEIFSYYSPWMKKIVSSLFLRYRNSTVDWRDCLQTAAIALIDSIGRYNPELGVPFEGYAYPRIKGAILNLVLKEASTARPLVAGFEEPEISSAEDSEYSFDNFLDSVIDIALSSFLGASAQRFSGLSIDPLEVYALHSQEQKMLLAISQLDGVYKFIIEGHYTSFLDFTEIAISLEISKSRVSQLHKEALRKLRIIYERL